MESGLAQARTHPKYPTSTTRHLPEYGRCAAVLRGHARANTTEPPDGKKTE
ncbi:MAG: hypothetical protein ABF436_11620 [Acetobacter okinawensis]|uniref:hypothetical protein n=1 Tax=Acetobacter okinawensis TaxID=1076594 RepID=UPI0039EC05AE